MRPYPAINRWAINTASALRTNREMNLPRIYLIAILLLLFSSFSVGQTIDEESNWYKEIGRYDDPYSRFDFKSYTKAELETAKSRYLSISSAKPADEWEGSYSIGTFLGHGEITWNRQNGFVYHYVYHTLASLDFGSATVRGDSVLFRSERTKGGTKRFFEVEYIKVMFGDRHLLLPKARLRDFAKVAAGRDIESESNVDDSGNSYFWEMVADEKKPISEVPIYPKRYAHWIRKPIDTKLQAVGSRKMRKEKSADGAVIYEEYVRLLTFSSGTKQGLRIGMRFWIDELEEWAEIVSVRSTRSVAELSRPFIDGKEYCDRYENYSQIAFPCRDPKIGMRSRTKTEYF